MYPKYQDQGECCDPISPPESPIYSAFTALESAIERLEKAEIAILQKTEPFRGLLPRKKSDDCLKDPSLKSTSPIEEALELYTRKLLAIEDNLHHTLSEIRI